MKAKSILYLILLAVGSACSDKTETEKILPDEELALQPVTFAAESGTDYAVSVFRKAGNSFLYQKTLNTGWSADGKLVTQLPVGDYQFLFAKNFGRNTLLSPALQTNTTTFDQLYFENRNTAGSTSQILPADELFLPVTEADKVYHLSDASVIRCTLKRAVAQVILYVRRGQKDGPDSYQPIPYENKKNITQALSSIQLELQNTGTSMNIQGVTQGQGSLSATFDATHQDTLTADGFAVYNGPCFFPAENEGEVTVKVTLQAGNNSPLPMLTATGKGSPKRNEFLIINVWILDDWNFVAVEADTREITKEKDGIQDIWDDQVTP